jgi:hypothetical protein
MFTFLMNKLLFIGFFLSILNVIRQTYFMIQALVINKEGYKLPKTELLVLGISIAFILTCIFTGIKF